MIAARLFHPAVLAALAIAAFAIAFGYQYLGGYQPCELCIWQRWALLPAIPLALAAWAMAPGSAGRTALLVLTALTFLVCAAVAGYHVGVEQHWWTGTDDCTGADLTAGGIDALRSQLLATPVVRCDEVTWSVLGISMAGYNLAFSLVAAGLALIAAGRPGRTASPRTGHQDGRISASAAP
ncbi:MAG: disulfide bond formation protein B [Rhodospirillaceae bacterium]|nr:disulfide bond formation protein B [Rhodospirillaceae bacterium]